MVHISTNEVFDGTLGRPYYEWDTPEPKSVYAQSKAAAEFYVRTLLNRFYIVRTSWLYAQGGNNFGDQDTGRRRPARCVAGRDRRSQLADIRSRPSPGPSPG